MARAPITRLPHESHDDFWGHLLRFSRWRGTELHNYAGERFTRWTVVGLEGWGEKGPIWLLRCDCGKEGRQSIQNLREGRSRSCGCLASEENTSHGMSGTRPYGIWYGMLQRCQSPSHDAYPNYGGRGIKVCDRWTSFEAWWLDMKAEYRPHLTLERRDVDGDYEPGNCAWATRKEQQNNRRCTKWIETPRGRMTVSQASEAFGISRSCLWARIRYGRAETRLLEGYCDEPPSAR